MISSLISIDYIPINVAIFKYQSGEFIFLDSNKKLLLTENFSKNSLIGKRLVDIFPIFKKASYQKKFHTTYETAKNKKFISPAYNRASIISQRKNEIIKLENGTIALFYEDIPLNISQNMVFENISKNSETISIQGYNNNHEVVYWNRASEILYGYTEEEAKGKKLEELIIPQEMKEIVHQSIEDWINKGISIPAAELTLKAKDGSSVNVYSSHAMVQINKDEIEMYCIDINLHDIKQLERKLTIQENFLHTIFNLIPDLVWIKDLEGRYLKCNPRFEQFYGIKESELLGHTDFDFIGQDLASFHKKSDIKTIHNNAPQINEEYLSFADGSYEGVFETIKTPMYDDKNQITGVLGIARDIQERKLREEKLEVNAHYDNLTGLANRVLFMDRFQELIKKREPQNRLHALLFIDLDSFKAINDSIGHAAGDKVLQDTAKRLQQSVRKGDTVSRLGGDEFTILLENIHSLDEVAQISTKILSILQESFYYQNHNINISASIGISIYPNDSLSPETLLQFADKAMYKAKANKKNNYKFYSSI